MTRLGRGGGSEGGGQDHGHVDASTAASEGIGIAGHSDYVLAAPAVRTPQRQVRGVDTNALRRVGVELDEDWEHEQACGTRAMLQGGRRQYTRELGTAAQNRRRCWVTVITPPPPPLPPPPAETTAQI